MSEDDNGLQYWIDVQMMAMRVNESMSVVFNAIREGYGHESRRVKSSAISASNKESVLRLPTLDDAQRSVSSGYFTPLDIIILNYTPKSETGEWHFRKTLLEVIDYLT